MTTASTSRHAQPAWTSTRSVITVITGTVGAGPVRTALGGEVVEQRVEGHHRGGPHRGEQRLHGAAQRPQRGALHDADRGGGVGGVVHRRPQPSGRGG